MRSKVNRRDMQIYPLAHAAKASKYHICAWMPLAHSSKLKNSTVKCAAPKTFTII